MRSHQESLRENKGVSAAVEGCSGEFDGEGGGETEEDGGGVGHVGENLSVRELVGEHEGVRGGG